MVVIMLKSENIEKYICCMKAGIQEFLAYRIQFLIGLFLLLIPFVIKNAIWKLAFASSKEIANYNLESILLYNYLILVLSTLINTTQHCEIANEIKAGDLSKYLAKPISHIKYWFSKLIGSKVVELIFIFIFSIIIFFTNITIFKNIYYRYLPISVLILILALIINFLLLYNLSMLSFKFLEISSFFTAINLILGFLNGEYLPIDAMPEVWIQISKYLPFNYGIFFLSKTIMGYYNYNEIFQKILIQFFWIAILGIFASYNWKRGIKKYESVGI